MEQVVLLTGATGTLGSHLLQRLVQQGVQAVCLVRARDEAEAARRIHDVGGGQGFKLALPGDVRWEGCGLSREQRRRLRGTVATILHCAASISFSDPAEAEAVNIEGLRNVLQLADELDVADFRHVSTAYVAGDAPRLDEDELAIDQGFRNPYEQSKFIGETLVHDWARRSGGRYTIFRPSILIGGADGIISSFDAYYTYARALAAIAESVRRRGGRSLPAELSISEQGVVRLPLVVQMSSSATLNLVPIDWVGDVVTKLLRQPSMNRTFHLVHPRPVLVRAAMEATLRHLGIEGLRIVGSKAEKERAITEHSPLLLRLQRRLDAVLDSYLPYTTGEAIFVARNAIAALGPCLQEPPLIDETYLCRLLDYASSVGWSGGPARPALSEAAV